jgi:hypothetical protein
LYRTTLAISVTWNEKARRTLPTIQLNYKEPRGAQWQQASRSFVVFERAMRANG